MIQQQFIPIFCTSNDDVRPHDFCIFLSFDFASSHRCAALVFRQCATFFIIFFLRRTATSLATMDHGRLDHGR